MAEMDHDGDGSYLFRKVFRTYVVSRDGSYIVEGVDCLSNSLVRSDESAQMPLKKLAPFL